MSDGLRLTYPPSPSGRAGFYTRRFLLPGETTPAFSKQPYKEKAIYGPILKFFHGSTNPDTAKFAINSPQSLLLSGTKRPVLSSIGYANESFFFCRFMGKEEP